MSEDQSDGSGELSTGVAIIRLLELYGVDTVFGIPGTHSIELYRGLSTSSIKHVSPRHEQGAGFMADGYARASGKPGVCFVISGPGVTNIATPMGQAKSDSVPLLIISPVNDPDSAGRNLGRLHEIDDQSAVTRPLTVFSEIVKDVDEIPRLIARAFDVFHSERPGPVHLHIPLSILRGTISQPWQASVIAAPLEPDASLIAVAASQIKKSRQCVIVAGGGCRHYGELVAALAEKIPCPAVTTVAGRGALPAGHPLSTGAQLAAKQCQDLVATSDLAIIVGTELSETDHWLDKLDLPEQQIWINLDQPLLDLRGQGLTILGDAMIALPKLSAQLDAPANDDLRNAYQRCQAIRQRHGETFDARQKKHWRVITEIRKALPAGCMVFSDMTQLAYTAIDHWPLEFSNSWHHPCGFGTLGFALPAAIGARFSDPELPLLVIVGDAGLQYTIAEMAVAGQYQSQIVVLLWQNESLQQIADDMHEAGIEPVGVAQDDPDFVSLAAEFGWVAKRLSGVFELGDAIEDAFSRKCPVLLELCEQDI